MNKIILYIATSLDGFIADKDGGVDWLPHPEEDSDDIFGYKSLLERISTIAMGSRSYKQILGFGDWAWNDKRTYVFTSQNITTTNDNIEFISKTPKAFTNELNNNQKNIWQKNIWQKNIWLLGGAELVKSFAKENLIDECIITIIPTTLGEGIKLDLPYDRFTLKSEKLCHDGMIQQSFIRKSRD